MTTIGKLKARTKLRGDTGVCYEVADLIGQGGFGTTYSGHRLSKSGRRSEKVCIKVCKDRTDWHGEAFFGQLLSRSPRVVRLIDAFVASTGAGAQQRRRHVLIFEFMDGGTVWDDLERSTPAWTEAKVRKEIKALLKVLALLHNAGVTHRDLKPDNIYLRNGRLTLGDFGTTKMALDPSMSSASVFAPGFAPKNVLEGLRWGQADDVFQVGLLAATLLSGAIWQSGTVSARSLAALAASDEFKCWIWHATGASAKRYWDATDAIEALDSLKAISLAPGRPPRSLVGQSVVFTGRLVGVNRLDAMARARAAGASAQVNVSDTTSLIVVGKVNAGGIGASEGLKLFAVRERRRSGQDIRVISQRQFDRLISRANVKGS